MTNLEYIRTLSAEELAEYFITPCMRCAYDHRDECNTVEAWNRREEK